MPKRKRDDGAVQDAGSSSVKQRRVDHKLKLGATKLGHAFKIAKGFERQKLSRRRKNAISQSNAKDVARIDSEIEALKTLDTSSAAQQHLFKTLSKIKSVAKHEDLPPHVRSATKLPSDVPTLNVIARLCKSNQGKAALDTAIVDIQQALGIDPDRSSVVKGKRPREKDRDGAILALKSNVLDGTDSLDATRQRRGSPSQSPESADEDGDALDVEPYEDRITPSQESAEEEFSDAEALEQRLLDEAVQQRSSNYGSQKYDFQADLSLSGSSSRSVSASPEPQKAPTTKKTSFLPSLTMGGYISGSDSEIDEIDMAPKKNRRGQRARQQIWEQKYGTSAKHLQKQSYATHFDAKRGAVDSNGRTRGRFGRERGAKLGNAIGGDPHAAHTSSKPAQNAKAAHRDDGGALHPSWEAAKKAKERKEAPVAFQGKKITFN